MLDAQNKLRRPRPLGEGDRSDLDNRNQEDARTPTAEGPEVTWKEAAEAST
jgi:hypothetical protein